MIRPAPSKRRPDFARCFRNELGREIVIIRINLGRWIGENSESHGGSNLRAVHGFVTARAPTCAPAQERRVVLSADQNGSRRGLLLEMALEAERLISGHEHFLIYRSLRLVAG